VVDAVVLQKPIFAVDGRPRKEEEVMHLDICISLIARTRRKRVRLDSITRAETQMKIYGPTTRPLGVNKLCGNIGVYTASSPESSRVFS
jgi:hypothetical protein